MSCDEFGAGLVIWDDGLRDVEVRLHPIFDLVGGWPLVAAVAIVGMESVGVCPRGLWLSAMTVDGVFIKSQIPR